LRRHVHAWGSLRENEAECEHEHVGRNKRKRIAPLHLKHGPLRSRIESRSSFARERRNALALIAPYGPPRGRAPHTRGGRSAKRRRPSRTSSSSASSSSRRW